MAQFETLWDGYINGTLTEEEVRQFLALLQREGMPLEEAIYSLLAEETMKGLALQGEKEQIYQAILDRTQKRRVRFFSGYRAAAAVLIFVLAGGAYFWLRHGQSGQTARGTIVSADIAPGRSGAVLTLSDGSRVELDSSASGVIASQGGAKAVLSNGQLQYNSTGAASGAVLYNTITTPKGRQFQLKLPDGTRVWLNSASSISYPVLFSGKERNVVVTGETYFDVAKNSGMPFTVDVNGRGGGDQNANDADANRRERIEVLGTQFNINAYTSERRLNTTLVEGSLRVITGREKVVIKPGQQVQVEGSTAGTLRQVVKEVDVDKVIAWKNGLFNFDGEHLTELLGQLERWYDIEVVVEKNVPDITFVGKMSRNTSLQSVLRNLEDLGVHFRLEGDHRLVVLP